MGVSVTKGREALSYFPSSPGTMEHRPPSAEQADALWVAWRERIEQAEDPTEFVQEFPDDALVVLLETAGTERATERNLVLAETLRRVSGRPSERSTVAAEVLGASAHRTSGTLDQAAQVIHETEAAVDAKSSSEHGERNEEATVIAHRASKEVETLRDLALEVERKADYLMRLHRTGMFVRPGRAGEEAEDKQEGSRG